MRKLLDLKAIGYGLATFVVAQLLVSLLSQSLMASTLVSPEKAAWILWPIEALVPAIAGFVSAWSARSHRITNGVIGGSLAIVMLVVFFAPFIRAFLGWGVPLLFAAFYGCMAFLGAAVGSYWRGKRGV